MIKYLLFSCGFILYPHSAPFQIAAALEITKEYESIERNSGTFDARSNNKLEINSNRNLSEIPPLQPTETSERVKVRRNQVVKIEYTTGQLKITVSARALQSGISGETINLLNTSSRSTLYGVVNEDGRITLKSNEYKHAH